MSQHPWYPQQQGGGSPYPGGRRGYEQQSYPPDDTQGVFSRGRLQPPQPALEPGPSAYGGRQPGYQGQGQPVEYDPRYDPRRQAGYGQPSTPQGSYPSSQAPRYGGRPQFGGQPQHVPQGQQSGHGGNYGRQQPVDHDYGQHVDEYEDGPDFEPESAPDRPSRKRRLGKFALLFSATTLVVTAPLAIWQAPNLMAAHTALSENFGEKLVDSKVTENNPPSSAIELEEGITRLKNDPSDTSKVVNVLCQSDYPGIGVKRYAQPIQTRDGVPDTHSQLCLNLGAAVVGNDKDGKPTAVFPLVMDPESQTPNMSVVELFNLPENVASANDAATNMRYQARTFLLTNGGISGSMPNVAVVVDPADIADVTKWMTD